MKLRNCCQGALLGVFCLVCLSVPTWGVDCTAQLTLSPAPIARGETLTIGVHLNNEMAIAQENTFLFVPLPLGIDQWKAEVRIDAGAWMAYPSDGLIDLDSVPASSQIAVDIQVPIEPAASATLTITAQWLNTSGVLAQASGWVNVLPSVDAGPDLIAEPSTPIALDAPSVFDGGGDVVSYRWTDFGVGGFFDDSLSLRPMYTTPAISGVIELSLTAMDEDGGESTDSLRVRVNAVPTLTIGGNLEAQEGSSILIGEASASDSDGWIASIAWSDGGSGGTFLPSADVIAPIYLVPEIEGCGDAQIVLTLQVIDDGGATSEATLTLHVTNANELPTVHLPGNFEVSARQQGNLSAQSSDEDGWIEQQEWEQIAGAAVELHSGSQAQTVWFEAPDADVRTELIFRFEATDNCGGRVTGDVTVTVVPDTIEDEPPFDDIPPTNDEPPSDNASPGDNAPPGDDAPPSDNAPPSDDEPIADGALSIDLDLFDDRGLPLSLFDSPSAGDVITVRVSAVNTGDSSLENLWATVNHGEAREMVPSQLEPWDSATGTIEWLVTASDWISGLEISATVTGTDERGRPVTAEGTFQFLAAIQDVYPQIQLEKTASVSLASVGDVIVYTYRVTNTGSGDLVGLTLHEDEWGWIKLPKTVLKANESISIDAVYTVREADFPGPLFTVAVAAGFLFQGSQVTAEASTSIELLDPVSEGGGGAYSQLQGKVVISEIAWAGSGVSPSDEWIELANIGDAPTDLAGWHIMWYEKTGVIPPMTQWHSIALAGVIQPLVDGARQAGPFDFTVVEDGLWSVRDPRWDVGPLHSGFYLVERGSDDVVANVTAGAVYGNAMNPYDGLPDAGATLFLVDAAGTIVDSANAQYADRSGWPAGNRLGATMERVNLEQGDFDANWQTTSCVLTYGTDAAGRELAATAGMPNSLSLDVLLQDAAARLLPVASSAVTTVLIPHTTASDRARIQMTAFARDSLGGGGGASRTPHLSTTRSSKGLTLQVDSDSAPSGSYLVWITLANGQALVLPIQI